MKSISKSLTRYIIEPTQSLVFRDVSIMNANGGVTPHKRLGVSAIYLDNREHRAHVRRTILG